MELMIAIEIVMRCMIVQADVDVTVLWLISYPSDIIRSPDYRVKSISPDFSPSDDINRRQILY
jgi:hypothetical protein